MATGRGASGIGGAPSSSTSGTNSCVAKGLDISLAALQRHDGCINSIVDVASQVALYTFNHRANEWEKTDVEGTLFVYTRSISPRHGFTIMNRLSMDNRTEPITKDLDFQLQDPFLLYRNACLSIYGIWFYDKEDCQRIAGLMKKLTNQEKTEVHQDDSSCHRNMHPRDRKSANILQLLNKAKDDYEKCKLSLEPKEIAATNVIFDNPNLIKPIPVKPSEMHSISVRQSYKEDTFGTKSLSLAGLFGTPEGQFSVKRDSRLQTDGLKTGSCPKIVQSLSYEEQLHVAKPTSNKNPIYCPAIKKLMNHRAVTELQPLSESPENKLSENSATQLSSSVPCTTKGPLEHLFHPHLTCYADRSMQLQESPTIIKKLHGANTAVGECSNGRSSNSPPKNLFPQASHLPPLLPPFVPGVVSPHRLLEKLQIVHQEQNLDKISKPVLAASFSGPVNQTAGMMDPCVENAKTATKSNLVFKGITSPSNPPAVSPAQLMSPMVFCQSKSTKALDNLQKSPPLTPVDCCPRSNNFFAPKQTTDSVKLSSPLTKTELQGTLLHLLRNDSSFLNIIYETYLSSLTTNKSQHNLPKLGDS
ncbi:mRNA-decapping enzyme 1B isoform X1 [Polypterus senegalus]|uniref:mRNA-decapping enzyme 1B isoform X1 n=2 Tax=Polypterus senegalus TaxID=55291 RepID=UPI001963D6F2|nr:mRNA-decapping enzyme 1B isoform X1 [Polypterus senegalus]